MFMLTRHEDAVRIEMESASARNEGSDRARGHAGLRGDKPWPCNACWAEHRMRYQNLSLIARGRGLAPL